MGDRKNNDGTELIKDTERENYRTNSNTINPPTSCREYQDSGIVNPSFSSADVGLKDNNTDTNRGKDLQPKRRGDINSKDIPEHENRTDTNGEKDLQLKRRGPLTDNRIIDNEACTEGVEPMGIQKQEEILKHQEREPPDGGWGWVVTFAAFVNMFVTSILSISFGILFSRFLLDLGSSSTMSAWIYNANYVISGIFTYLFGPIIEELGWRKVSLISSFLFSVGMIITAFATSASFLFFSVALVMGSTQFILAVIAYSVVSSYFRRWRSHVNAFMSTGSCISQMVMPPLITSLQEEYGVRGATLITGAIIMNACVAAMTFHPIEWHLTKQVSHGVSLVAKCEEEAYSITLEEKVPSGYGTSSVIDKEEASAATCKTESSLTRYKKKQTSRKSDGEPILTKYKSEPWSEKPNTAPSSILYTEEPSKRNTEKQSLVSANKEPSKFVQCVKRILGTARYNASLLKSPVVLIICLVESMLIVVSFNIFEMVPFAMVEAGFSQEDASFCLSVSGLCNLSTRGLSAFLPYCPNIKMRTWYLLGSATVSISIIGFSVSKSLLWQAIMVGLVGAGYGLNFSINGLLVVEELGLAFLMPILSTSFFMSSIFFLTVGPLAGVIRDTTGSYVASLCFCAACLLSTVVLGLFIPTAHKYQSKIELRRGEEKQKQ